MDPLHGCQLLLKMASVREKCRAELPDSFPSMLSHTRGLVLMGASVCPQMALRQGDVDGAKTAYEVGRAPQTSNKEGSLHLLALSGLLVEEHCTISCLVHRACRGDELDQPSAMVDAPSSLARRVVS